MATNKIETFGSPISETVEKQLAYRSQFNLKGLKKSVESRLNLSFNPTTDQFNNKQLFNTAWINLISSVNNIDPDAQDSDKESNLAKRFILSGGALAWDGTKLVKREQIIYDLPEDGSSYGKTGKYNRNTQTGVKPMPGITGFRIISKNLNGTIREATLDFNVWSLPELEDIEKLYLRPGYHVIVEWGHTYGLDGEGNPTSFPLGTYDNYKTFFETTPADTIYGIIEKTREKNFGNYDAFIGLVKNFSWSFRQDGGYDCSISVISKGEVLESLTVRSGLPSAEENIDETKEQDFSTTNLLTKFVKVVNSFNIRNDGTVNEFQITFDKIATSADIQALELTDVLFYLQEYKNKKGKDIICIKKNFVQKSSFWSLSNFFGKDKGESFSYVTLELLLYFVNTFIRTSTSSKKVATFNLDSDQTYFLFEKYVNIAPYECIVPVSSGYFIPGKPTGKPQQAYDAYPFIDIKPSGSTRILDILISLDFFYTELKNFIETSDDPEEFDIISFVKTFLKKLETSIGSINEFDLEFSEEKNLYTIVDRRFQEVNDVQKIPTLSIYGANSIALDLSIQTKITNKLGSQISIAAQGPDGDAQFNSSMPEFKKWNTNLIDRFDPFVKPPEVPKTEKNIRRPVTSNEITQAEAQRDRFNSAATDATATRQSTQARTDNTFETPTTPELTVPDVVELPQEPIEAKVQKFYLKLDQAYRQWWQNNFQPENNYWHSIRTQGQTIYSMIASEFKTSKGLPPQGIIPTVISVKLDGIGGIKIGQTFKINKGVLPKRYKDFGYIITGIEHGIENNKWTTEIKAQTYYVGKPSEEEKKKAIDRLNRFLPFGSGGGGSPSAPSAQRDTNFVPTNSELKDQAKAKAEEYLGRPLSDKEWRLLIAGTSAEASSNPEERAWVAAVILNRTRAGGTVEDTLYAKNQFQAVTGTTFNPGPSPNFSNGPNKLQENSIYSAFNNFLDKKKIETSYINFTSANTKAYGPGTDISYLDKLRNSKGSRQIGQTVFAKRI